LQFVRISLLIPQLPRPGSAPLEYFDAVPATCEIQWKAQK